MPRSCSLGRLALLLSATTTLLGVNGQTSTFPATPLASKHFAYPTGIPYQVDTEPYLIRGGQTGYNQCNSTTEGSGSLCQTSFLSALDDFCLWAPRNPNSLIADTEGEEVAWCTKPGHGTRLIPPGALQGVQFMKTPDYVQVVGFIDQTKINLQADDSGGELDPHGADLRGNPLGSLVYSTAWGNGTEYTQVIEWHNFMGGSQFCFKACDPSKPNAAHYCEHVYDRIGQRSFDDGCRCAYNAPNNAQNGTFESCLGENQDFPGVYTTDGQVMTYKQPPESLGPISSLPYTARVPASSSCTQYTSAQLFSALGAVSSTASASATTTGGGSGGSTGGGAAQTGSQTKSGASAGASATGTGGAEALSASLVSGLLGVAFAAVFLA
ncbi:manno protein [Mycena albidolilacea]|uniref:Manno protein n=1 Tax=Mycena albidolilacea TaxID=1033008 RepID=A0AAD6ZRU6_9AGAR|nr:manno protein [Mycena albidolilacea]